MVAAPGSAPFLEVLSAAVKDSPPDASVERDEVAGTSNCLTELLLAKAIEALEALSPESLEEDGQELLDAAPAALLKPENTVSPIIAPTPAPCLKPEDANNPVSVPNPNIIKAPLSGRFPIAPKLDLLKFSGHLPERDQGHSASTRTSGVCNTSEAESKWGMVDVGYINHRSLLSRQEKLLSAQAQTASGTVAKTRDGKWKVDTSYVQHRTSDLEYLGKKPSSARSHSCTDPYARSVRKNTEANGKWAPVEMGYLNHRTSDFGIHSARRGRSTSEITS